MVALPKSLANPRSSKPSIADNVAGPLIVCNSGNEWKFVTHGLAPSLEVNKRLCDCKLLTCHLRKCDNTLVKCVRRWLDAGANLPLCIFGGCLALLPWIDCLTVKAVLPHAVFVISARDNQSRLNGMS